MTKQSKKKAFRRWKEAEIREMASLYEAGRSLSEVGEKHGTCAKTVQTLLKRVGFQRRRFTRSAKLTERNNRRRKILDKNQLIELYVGQRLSLDQIRRQLHTGYEVITHSLRFHQITIRESVISPLTEELLRSLYLEKRLTAKEIAVRCGRAEGTVKAKLREYRIRRKPGHDRRKKRAKASVSTPKMRAEDSVSLSKKPLPNQIILTAGKIENLKAYYEKGHSIKETGKKFGLTSSKVFRVFRKEGFKTRDYTISKTFYKSRQKLVKLPPEKILRELYLEKNLKVKEIIKTLGICPSHFYACLEHYGITKQRHRTKKAA